MRQANENSIYLYPCFYFLRPIFNWLYPRLRGIKMLKYLIPLFALLLMPIAHADTPQPKPSYTKTMYPALNEAVSSRGLFDDSISVDHERLRGSSKVTLSKNYPIVPYDPNHPNVKKQAQFDIKAKAKTLAGRFGRGLNALALGAAVAELIGEGIDWVLDPENNSVRYNTPDGYMWQSTVFDGNRLYPTQQLAAQGNCNAYSGCIRVKRLHKLDDNNYQVFVQTENIDETPAWTVTRVQVDQEQSIPLGTVAQHVINNETYTGDTNITNNYYYYDAVNDTLVEQVENGEHDEDIKEAVKRLQDDQPDSDTGTSTENKDETDGKTEEETDDKTETATGSKFPDFCTWAKPVCDWLKWTKEQYEEFLKEPKLKDEPIDIQEETGIQWQDKAEKTYVSFNGQCPANVNIPISWGGATTTLHLSYEPFCRFAVLIKPAVILGAWISALMIISGGRTKE